MDEIIPGLWIGNLPSALDVETLKANNIFSILSAMRGKISIHETFIKHQLLLDDTEEADILQHFLPSISFIQAELNKGRGVLVHCQAGLSRSVAIVAAYLMCDRHLTPDQALELIRKARPSIDPNSGFLAQLEIFHNASYKISGRDKNTRMFYLERTVEEVLNGDGSIPSTEMFAKFPQTPAASAPVTPGASRGPRRRIRCKMCRQELAAREHMLDHGQLGPATPATISPAASRRPSTNQHTHPLSRNPSMSMTPAHPIQPAPQSPLQPLSRQPSGSRPRVGSASASDSKPRRSSLLALGGPSIVMSNLNTDVTVDEKEELKGVALVGRDAENADPDFQTRTSGERRPSAGNNLLRPFASLSQTTMESVSMSALESSDEDEEEDKTSQLKHGGPTNVDESIQLGRRLSDAMLVASPLTSPELVRTHDPSPLATTDIAVVTKPNSSAVVEAPPKLESPYFANPNDLAAQLHANPKLAALRSPVSITPNGITPLGGPSIMSPTAELLRHAAVSPPIIMNPKCSGYFVEPMKWMEFFLEEGQIAGKIICPNTKCGAKLGNYDWAGVCCGCKEWVVPGFCINRSKVDEVVH